MAVESKGIFTKIDNMLMEPITKTMNDVITHHYCALAAQLKAFHALYNIFMATICLCPRFIITGCETTDNTSII
ncbi:hypothetical protein [Bartonella grahamii]|uniref:Uncharacterized protein n=1 Tax=Bartonella grahamii TaxID=33045 RepID=A0A336NL39_BARGR|nr:hypothetical protein [Bartonella grahamii]SSZ39492.1 Uncharacterised protein [Bartonella grahamii]